MYACAGLEPTQYWLSFKCDPEDFATLLERQGVSPAPYLARAHWVAIEPKCSLSPDEIKQLVKKAHSLVFAKLPKKLQSDLVERTSRKNGAVKRKKPQ